MLQEMAGRWSRTHSLEVNPFHAIILLSSDTTNDIDRKEAAMELARLSRHVPPRLGACGFTLIFGVRRSRHPDAASTCIALTC